MSRIRDAINALSPTRSSEGGRGKSLLDSPLAPRVTCEAPECRQESRVLTHGRNLCLWHYEHEHDAAAREYAAEHGLRTPKHHARHGAKLGVGFGKHWTRERMVEHWRKVLSEPPRAYIAHEIATQALANLHAVAEREVGADDE